MWHGLAAASQPEQPQPCGPPLHAGLLLRGGCVQREGRRSGRRGAAFGSEGVASFHYVVPWHCESVHSWMVTHQSA